MRKRCSKGKSCGATCIDPRERCVLELGPLISTTLKKARRLISLDREEFVKGMKEMGAGSLSAAAGARNLFPSSSGSMPSDLKAALKALPPPPGESDKTSVNVRKDISNVLKGVITDATGNTKWARDDAKDFDSNLGKVARVGDKQYADWKDSYDKGSTKIGEGSFGTVIRNPDGTFVKRGAVSSTEAQIINRLGKIDLGPKLIAADINGLHQYMASPGVSVRDGRIAMSGVEGKPLGVRSSTYTKFNGEYAPNVYWKAMAELHRQGIAHNDAHPDNIMVDNKGKGRWVDLGLAQSSPKAALAEVLGSFTGPKGQKPVDATPPTVMNSSIRVEPGKGNWQTRRWAATGIEDLELNRKNPKFLKEYREEMPVLAKILDNSSRVNDVLKTKYKMSDEDIETLYTTSIRSPISSYNQGVWGKLTDKQAQDLINQVYEGV